MGNQHTMLFKCVNSGQYENHRVNEDSGEESLVQKRRKFTCKNGCECQVTFLNVTKDSEELHSGVYCIEYPTKAHNTKCHKVPVSVPLAKALEEEPKQSEQSEPRNDITDITEEDIEAFWEEGEDLFRSRRYNAREMHGLLNVTGSKNEYILHHLNLNQEALYAQLVLKTGYKRGCWDISPKSLT
jgi:hypothetical protein